MKKGVISRLRPTHYVYLLVHLVITGAGFWMMGHKSAAMQAIGSSIIATGMTGWVIFIYIFLVDDVQQKFRLLYEAGVTQAFSARGSTIKDEYDDRLRKARSSIDLLGFGQRNLREDYVGKFGEWKARSRVRILLIDPDFPSKNHSYAKQRDTEEGAAAGTIASDVMRFLRDTNHLRDDRFQVRLYKCLPSVSIFRIDDEILWGPYLSKKVSRNSPTFVVKRGGDVFEALQSHFDSIWDSEDLSREAPIEKS